MTDEHPRLSDKLMAAHEQACLQGKADLARCLLRALELELSGDGGRPEQRAADQAIEDAFARQRLLDGT